MLGRCPVGHWRLTGLLRDVAKYANEWELKLVGKFATPQGNDEGVGSRSDPGFKREAVSVSVMGIQEVVNLGTFHAVHISHRHRGLE